MGAKGPFTKREAVLLLFYLLEALTGKMRRTEAIERCSADLRRMARAQGMNIDPDYRNLIGIREQMRYMESAYYGNTVRTCIVWISWELASPLVLLVTVIEQKYPMFYRQFPCPKNWQKGRYVSLWGRITQKRI